jgi:hypothetical protein
MLFLTTEHARGGHCPPAERADNASKSLDVDAVTRQHASKCAVCDSYAKPLVMNALRGSKGAALSTHKSEKSILAYSLRWRDKRLALGSGCERLLEDHT